MEIFELRYFLGVARFENLHRAAEKLNVSPGSLSKAIARLEEELAVPLFNREGRGIRLTDHGRLLQKKASEIVQMEESARISIGGHAGKIQAVLAGPEVLLCEMGVALIAEIQKKHTSSSFEFHHADDQAAIQQVARGEAHLALVTSDVPAHLGLDTKVFSEPYFHTYVGKGHKLNSAAIAGKTVAIEDVLKHGFASPSHPLLGQVGPKQSLDGWRDDRFPRRVEFLTSSLKMLEELAVRGRALVYLPDYFGDRLTLTRLKIKGCPYSCTQKVHLVGRNVRDTGWLARLF